VSLHIKTKPHSYPKPIIVNMAGIWNEGYCSFLGRPVEWLTAAKHQPKRATLFRDNIEDSAEVSRDHSKRSIDCSRRRTEH